ncbi:MAG: ABC transporter ATP-binding protein, partial [Rhodoferax sp.]
MPLPTPKAQTRLVRRLARLWPYFGKPYAAWLMAFGATVVMSLTEPLIPALLQPLLDKGFQQGALDIWVIPLTLILLFGTRGLAGFSAQLALAKITNRGLLILREAMFDKLLDARLTLFGKQSSSALANTIVYEVQTGSVLLVNALTTLTRDSLTLLALVGYLLFLNWRLTLIVTVLFPAVAFVMRTLSKRLYRLTKESQDATDALAYVVEENVLAHRDVRLQAAQPSQARRFKLLGEGLKRLSMKSTAASAAMTPLTQILAAFALSAVISVALAQSAGHGTSVGSFAAFVTAMLMLVAPVKHLSELASPITRGLAAMERGLDLIAHTPSESGGTFVKARAQGSLSFRQVGVTYPQGNTPALEQFSLEVKPGETIAL